MPLEKFKLTFDDIIAAICRRPKMYTMNGTFGEVLALLDGYANGARLSPGRSSSFFNPFSQWLQEKLNMSYDHFWRAFRDSYPDDEAAIKAFAAFWTEYQAELQSTASK